jgi:hypothetical protein
MAHVDDRPNANAADRLGAAGVARSRWVATFALAAGMAIVASGCGAAAGSDPRLAILKRASAADSPFGVRYTFRSIGRDGEGTLRSRGYGQEQADGQRSRTVVAFDGGRGETIVDGDVEYNAGDFAISLEGVRPNLRWTRLDRSRVLDAGYIDDLCGPELPTRIAGVLASSDPKVEELGRARIGGLRTQRYRVSTTYGRVLDVLAGDEDASQCDSHDRAARFVAILWIDRHGMIRRVRLSYRLVDGATVQTRNITRYDRSVHVMVPGGPGVLDVTDSLLKRVHSFCEDSDEC